MGIFYNKNASKIRNNLFSPPDRHPMEFHHHLQGYQPTPLVDAQELAATLHVGRIWIKDESDRLGLPSFKILGTSWAIYRALIQRFGNGFERWNTLEGFAEQLKPLRPITLAAATDGNHGRAVARIAALLKFDAHIFVPIGTAEARIKAIESEGATVTIVNGTYDDAIATASREESERCLVISDVSWAGYEDIPKWIIEGYSTIFLEVDDELAIRQEESPDLVLVQVGVGALAAAVVRHYRNCRTKPKIVSIEPTSAGCVLASMKAGQLVSEPGPHTSMMVGLNCGTPSPIAWPLLKAGIDLFITIEDDKARQGMRNLAKIGIVSGETGAAGMGGLLEVLSGTYAKDIRNMLGIHRLTRVLLFSTEGATDIDNYKQIVKNSLD